MLFTNRITAFIQPNHRLANRQPSGNKRHCVVFGTQAKNRESFLRTRAHDCALVVFFFRGGEGSVFLEAFLHALQTSKLLREWIRHLIAAFPHNSPPLAGPSDGVW